MQHCNNDDSDNDNNMMCVSMWFEFLVDYFDFITMISKRET